MINWKTRIRNKTFISAMISMGLLVVKQCFNIELPIEVDAIVELALTIVTTLGIIVDPDSEGFSDRKEKDELENTLEFIMDAIKVLSKDKK